VEILQDEFHPKASQTLNIKKDAGEAKGRLDLLKIKSLKYVTLVKGKSEYGTTPNFILIDITG
jgi:hypothetical protein